MRLLSSNNLKKGGWSFSKQGPYTSESCNAGMFVRGHKFSNITSEHAVYVQTLTSGPLIYRLPALWCHTLLTAGVTLKSVSDLTALG